MRLVRLISVFVGVGLIVAVAAGYLARTAELRRDRDLWVETTAELAATELDFLLATVELVAELSESDDEALGGFGPLTSQLDICVAPVTTVGGGCAVPGAEPVTVVGSSVVIVARGPDVVVSGSIPVDALKRSARVSAASSALVDLDLRPLGDTVDERADAAARTVGERREAARPLSRAAGWTMVAALPDQVSIDPTDRTMLAVLLVLAVLLLALAGFTIVAEQRRLVERANLDPLTRLPNRGEFERRGTALVQTAVKGGEGACLMLVDLDGFKAVNDTFGHQAGDEILKVVAMRLRNAVRGYDLVARWGGDEFVIVLQGVHSEVLAANRADALATLVGARLRADDGGPELQVGASIGIALLHRHGVTLRELLAAADAAMYEAKRAGDPFRLAEPAGTAGAYADEGVVHSA